MDPRLSLKEVRAAQLRTRLQRVGLRQLAFGTLFLMGALMFAAGPQPDARASAVWMVLLSLTSTLHVGLGLRIFFRVKRWPKTGWPIATVAWGGLLALVLRHLVNLR